MRGYNFKNEKCPHCGKDIKLHAIKMFSFLKGSPIRTCPNCNKTYFYKEYKELGLVLFEDRGDEFSIWEILGSLLFHTCLFFYFHLAKQYGYTPQILRALGIGGGIALLLDYRLVRAIKNSMNSEAYHQKQIDLIEGRSTKRSEELIESMERLSNREYLDALKEHGVDVPDYFYERLYNMHGKIE